jgi:hypothetical protein
MAKAKRKTAAQRAADTARRLEECGNTVVKRGRRRGQAAKGNRFDGKHFCPVPAKAKAAKAPRKKRETKAQRVARSYYTGGSSAGYDAWKRGQTYDPGAAARHYREERTGIEGAHYGRRSKKAARRGRR